MILLAYSRICLINMACAIKNALIVWLLGHYIHVQNE